MVIRDRRVYNLDIRLGKEVHGNKVQWCLTISLRRHIYGKQISSIYFLIFRF